MKRINGFLLVLNSPCPRFSSFPLSGMVSYMHFFQRRTMYQVQVTKSSLLNSSLSSSKLIFRPVSKFLLSAPSDLTIEKYILDSLSPSKLVFETYALLSLGSSNHQDSFDKLVTKALFTKFNGSIKEKNVFVSEVFLKFKEKMVEHLTGLDFLYKEEMLTAFTIGDNASVGCSSKSLREEVKHAFILLNLNLKYGSDSLRFVMALGKIGILTPDYNKLNFDSNDVTILDGKEPSSLFILNNHDYLSKLRSSYGSDTACALDTKIASISDQVVERPDYFYFNSNLITKMFLQQTVLSAHLIPLAQHIGWDDINVALEMCGYNIKLKIK